MHRLIALILLPLWLAACGAKGPLYMPGHDPRHPDANVTAGTAATGRPADAPSR